MKRLHWIVIALLLVVTMACGGKETVVPTNTPAPTNTPVPTTPPPSTPTTAPTDIPEPTATPVPEETPETPEAMEIASIDLDLDEGWYHFTNGNYVRDIDVYDGVIVAATGGGVVVWEVDSGDPFAFTTLDWLPTNNTYAAAICALDTPKMYIGTEYGIATFSEETEVWETMTPDNSGMYTSDVDFLDCDEERGVLLIGYTFGLDIYDYVNDSWDHLDEDDGLITDWVDQAKYIGDDLWIVSSFGSSVVHADGSVEGFDEDLGNIPDEGVEGVDGDANGTIWMAAFDGLMKYSGGEFTLYNSDNVENFPFLDAFERVIVASDGTVWAGNTFGSVCQFDPVAETCLNIYEDEDGMVGGLNAMVMDENEHLYIADDGEGISAFDGSSWESFILDELPLTNSYMAVTQTPDGYLWFGGGFGLQIVSVADAYSPWDVNDMDGYTVNTFFHTADGWWIGHGAGASFYDYEKEGWTNYARAEEAGEGIYDGSVTAITVDGKGRVWFGTYNGLTVMDGDTFTYYDLLTDEKREEEYSPLSVNALLFDGTNVWVGAYGTLFRFDENDEITIWEDDLPGILSLFSVSTHALALNTEGDVLLGVGSRLMRYDAEDDSFHEIYEAESDIYTILAPPSGELWLGTYSNGVAVFDGDAWFTLTTEDGLSSNHFSNPQSILIDAAGTVWFAPSNGGLTRFVP